ncbi:porin [Sulfurospirillum sp.]|nr:porin [Sulfurospirillum sp.]
MNKSIKVAALVGLSAVTLSASGFRIPEQSLNSTALSAAYVANANGADASYFNPANMVWGADSSEMEMALTYINLPSIKYTDVNPAYNSESKEEHFYVPTFHYVSPSVGDWRFGLSMVAPGGLSKRWDDPYQTLKAKEFTLQVIEINPNAAYKVNDKLAVGFGLRALYTTGIIKFANTNPGFGSLYENNMEADSIDFGYNLALSYKPIENLTLATTYRSKVDLTVSGDAKGFTALGAFDTSAETSVPLPASLALAAAYTMNRTTVEFVFERTYWSAYKELDLNFGDPVLEGAFGTASDKNWSDVNAYRIGVTHQYNDKLKLMAAFAIDENPIPESTVSFELPDSDAKLYSIGAEYKINANTKIGLAYLYDQKETRTITGGVGHPNGKFEDSSAHLVTASFKYKF